MMPSAGSMALQVVHRHAVGVQLHVQDRGLALALVTASQLGESLAQGDVALSQRSGLLLQIEISGVFHGPPVASPACP